MYSYVGDVSLLCGVEDIDNTTLKDRPKMFDSVARPYVMAYSESFNKLPSCGVGGPNAQTAEAEKNKETNLDLVAGLTGEMLGEIMCWREDEWQEEMRTLGFYMGKFIYLMDAYEDYEADQKKNCYNPLVYMEKENDQEFDTFCKLLLTSMMSECAKSFERLPILLHADILRNILYSGVWSRYEYLQLRKKKTGREKDERRKKENIVKSNYPNHYATRRRSSGIGENHGFSACRKYIIGSNERVLVLL